MIDNQVEIKKLFKLINGPASGKEDNWIIGEWRNGILKELFNGSVCCSQRSFSIILIRN